MKKHLAFFFLLLIAIYGTGYYWAATQNQIQTEKWNARMAQFQIRTEEYEPSCKELQNKDKPTIITKNVNHFIVIVRADDFVVFGLNTEADKPPITSWWSANLQNAVEQACAKGFKTGLSVK